MALLPLYLPVYTVDFYDGERRFGSFPRADAHNRAASDLGHEIAKCYQIKCATVITHRVKLMATITPNLGQDH